jgi:Icc protein
LEFLVGKNISTQRAFDYLTWRIILLNSLKQGAVSGELATCELDFLKQQLDQHQKSILIALHHHPVPVASKMIDQYPLENATELWDIVSNYPQVKLILSGHVHQEFRQRVGHVEVLTCPSTCMQFAPHAEKLQFDSLAPGYRWIELQPQGAYQTGIVRISPYLNWQNYIYD